MSDGEPSPSADGSRSAWDRERIVELLLEAGRMAVSSRQSLKTELKPDQSIVTEADRAIEELFTRELERPGAGVFIIGEETIDKKGEDYVARALDGVSYIVDPIDGTAPYSHNLPYWGISIGRLQAGRLTDGAVFLPEAREGEILLSDGDAVVEGVRRGGAWDWRAMSRPAVEEGPSGLIAVAQEIAKRRRTHIRNSLQALGTAVFTLAGVLQGRFVAYVGSLRLWDVAGCLPLLARLGFSLTHYRGGEALGLEVDGDHYELDPEHRFRWGVRGGLLVCAPELEERLRNAFSD